MPISDLPDPVGAQTMENFLDEFRQKSTASPCPGRKGRDANLENADLVWSMSMAPLSLSLNPNTYLITYGVCLLILKLCIIVI